ncbi:MAG: hypothetical protein MHM6MM_008429 [Cercozoa sp. M6MM]
MIQTQEFSAQEEQYATLDEPVSATILRDLRRIGVRLRAVLLAGYLPSDTRHQLRSWDLWGPLLLCLLLAISLSWSQADADQKALVFAAVFVIVWVGAAVVTLNAQLLGGRLSFFHSVSALGYCVAPLVLASCLCWLSDSKFFRTPVVTVGFLWATRASQAFVRHSLPKSRRALAVFPVALFYAFLSFMVLVQ